MTKKKTTAPSAEMNQKKDRKLRKVHVDAAGKAYTKKDLKDIESTTSFDNIIIGKKSCICKIYVNKIYSPEEYTGPSSELSMVCHAIFSYYYIYLSY